MACTPLAATLTWSVVPWILLSEAKRPHITRDRQAWIVVGDLERALCQAGMLEALLRSGQRPSLIYAGGIATVNAMLSRSGRSADLQRGWERLRASRFLPAAALDARGTSLFVTRAHAKALKALRTLLASTIPGDDTTGLVLLTTTGIAEATLGSNGAGPLPDFLSCEVLSADATPANIAAALTDACRRGATRIIVCAVDEADFADDTILRTAINSARTSGTEVGFLGTNGHSPLGLLHYLLPGSGGAERLIASGREAAQAFLDRGSEHRPN